MASNFDYSTLDGFPCPCCRGLTIRFQRAPSGHIMFSLCSFINDDRFAHLDEKEVERRRDGFMLSPDEFARDYPEAVVSLGVEPTEPNTTEETES